MKSIIESIKLGAGLITYNDISVKENLSLEEQVDSLKEDMLQIEFPNGIIVDVGWFPSFNYENGRFHIRVIVDNDWDSPVFFSEAKKISVMKKLLSDAIEIANNQQTRTPIN